MLRAFLKLALLIVVLLVAGAFLFGWWSTGRMYNVDEPRTVGTTGADPDVNEERARAVGAEAGERTAVAAERTGAAFENAAEKTAEVADRAADRAAYAAEQTRKAIAEGSVTAKIKAKMALDDHVKALDLDVDTAGSVVTVSGFVNTQAEKDRALALARDTEGVTHVIDRVQIKP